MRLTTSRLKEIGQRTSADGIHRQRNVRAASGARRVGRQLEDPKQIVWHHGEESSGVSSWEQENSKAGKSFFNSMCKSPLYAVHLDIFYRETVLWQLSA